MPEFKKSSPLKPFEDHGIKFIGQSGSSQQADCPFCGKTRAFHVNPSTTLWICSSSPAVCGRSGNLTTFLQQWVEYCNENTSDKRWRKLSAERDGLPVEIFQDMKMGYNELTDKWLIPIETPKRTIQDVRRWSPGKRMMGTTGCKTGLWNAPVLFAEAYRDWHVDLCEGEWDGGVMRWLNRKCNRRSIVVAVPGARVFKAEWVEWFKGRDVTWWYDNDSDGITFSYKRHFLLKKVARSQNFVTWPDTFASGFDVRDFVVGGLIERNLSPKKTFFYLKTHITKEHQMADLTEDRENSTPEAREMKRERPPSNPTFDETLSVYRKWLKMRPDLVDCLRMIYACVLANQWPGNPVWGFLVGPPGSGKTELLMSLSQVFEVLLESSVGPKTLVSGFKMPKSGDDPSLIPKMINKTTVFKDWTEIMDMSEQEQRALYGLLRGAYDGQVDRTYGNGEVRHYKGRFGILAGVTNKIHGQSRVTVGERFLKFQMRPLKPKTQDELMRKAIMTSMVENEKKIALSDAALAFLDRDVPEVEPSDMLPEWAIERLIALAQLIAKLRHEVEWDNVGGGERSLRYKPQEEVGTRLSVQLTKFAMGLTLVAGRKKIDMENWRLVERIAFNTGIGYNLDVVEAMMLNNGGAMEFSDIKEATSMPSTTLRRKLEDLVVMDIIKPIGSKIQGVGRPPASWKVSPVVEQLWRRVRPVDSHLKDARRAREI